MVETKEFIWLTNDLVFKHVFSHEELTKDFLNAYLKFVCSDLEVLKVEVTPQMYIQNDNIKLHDYYLDICVVLSNKEIVNLEMYTNFGLTECKKSLTYASMLYSHQLKKNESYGNAKKVTSLNIMSGNYDGVNYEFLNKYELCNNKNHKALLEDGLELLLLRLDIFDKKEYSLDKSRCVKWLKFMNCKSYEEAEKLAKGDRILMSTIEIVKSFVSDPEVISLFDRDKLKEESAELRGKTIGIAEGKTIGIAQEKASVARKMLKAKMNFKSISEMTGLSISEIKKLA